MPSRPPVRLNMAREIVENGLPTASLLLDGMGLLAIEGHLDFDTIWAGSERDPGRAIAEGIFDQLVCDELRIGSSEIEAHAAIFRFHARREVPAYAQVDRGGGGVPIIGRGIPLFDILRRRISAPNLLDGRGDGCFDSNLHRVPLA